MALSYRSSTFDITIVYKYMLTQVTNILQGKSSEHFLVLVGHDQDHSEKTICLSKFLVRLCLFANKNDVNELVKLNENVQ